MRVSPSMASQHDLCQEASVKQEDTQRPLPVATDTCCHDPGMQRMMLGEVVKPWLRGNPPGNSVVMLKPLCCWTQEREVNVTWIVQNYVQQTAHQIYVEHSQCENDAMLLCPQIQKQPSAVHKKNSHETYKDRN
mmetsp:Transcript_4787/g.8507  ORF Transcript_4787/g.8507 Transcript_4787/m.8507 type:complete len:134 (-) Transcript_4787:596-997(-)